MALGVAAVKTALDLMATAGRGTLTNWATRAYDFCFALYNALGTASRYDVGTGPNDIPVLDATGNLPASVLGNVMNLPTGNISASRITGGVMAGDRVAQATASARGTALLVFDTAELNNANRATLAVSAEFVRRAFIPPGGVALVRSGNAWSLSWTWESAWQTNIDGWEYEFLLYDGTGAQQAYFRSAAVGAGARNATYAGTSAVARALARVRPKWLGGAVGAWSGWAAGG